MIVGTYDVTTLNSKDLRHKKFIDTEPENGEKPKISDLGRELLGESTTEQAHTAAPPPPPASIPSVPSVTTLVEVQVAKSRASEAESPSTVTPTADLPLMTEHEKAKYYAMFDAAYKESRHFINLEEAMEQSHAFGLPPDIATDIWNRSDANHDRRWNIDEYANAIHEIMIETGKQEGMYLYHCRVSLGQSWLTYCEQAIGSQDSGPYVLVPTTETPKTTAPTASAADSLEDHPAALKVSEAKKLQE